MRISGATFDSGAIVNRVRGIVQISAPAGGLEKGDTVEVEYIGSDDFYVEVENGPILNAAGEALAGANVTDVSFVVPGVNFDDKNVDSSVEVQRDTTRLPSGNTNPSINGKLVLIEISDGQDSPCKHCRLRFGVIAGPKDGDEMQPLSPRISVIGISYDGAERINIPNGREADDTFKARLDFIPVDVNFDATNAEQTKGVNPADIKVLSSTLTGTDPVRITGVDERNRIITFTIDTDAGFGQNADNDGTEDVTRNDYVDIAYTVRTQVNPRNALLPFETDRPIMGALPNSRITIESDNDRASVTAESGGPKFANPSPSSDGATPDAEQVIGVDVTDELAGVKEDTIKMTITVTGSEAIEVDSDTKGFSTTEIDGGYRATIALDDVDPNVDDDDTTTISWYATATDNAGNTGRSDADSDTEDVKEQYDFDVDGQAPTIVRVYTGDWFDPTAGSDGQVKGDRLPDRAENHLPGVSDNTSLRVVFNEPIDADSVTASDFTVDGTEPLDAVLYSEGDTGATGVDADITTSVFLTVSVMAPDLTPVVEIVGSVSDVAGNATTEDEKVGTDGIAPIATLSVDKTLSDKQVVVTVETDERIQTLSPRLNLYVRNAVDRGEDGTLDETDSFTVGCKDANLDDEDEERSDQEEYAVLGGVAPELATSEACELALRNDATGAMVASGDQLAAEGTFEIVLSSAPILDKTDQGTGAVDPQDVTISTDSSNRSLVSIGEEEDDFNGETGALQIEVAERTYDPTVSTDPATTEDDVKHGLVWGDEITFSYRGTGVDSAEDLVSTSSGSQVTSTSWTFPLSITRPDRYAVTATVEDGEGNQRTGGIADPESAKATVFEIDNQLAGGVAARTVPSHDAAGNRPVSISDPFFIEFYWDGTKNERDPASLTAGNEAKEYPGDSSRSVTLTKAVLNGPGFDDVDVLDTAVPQSSASWRMGIAGLEIGSYTLTYDAEDALGNDYESGDQSLAFTVQAVPSWKLSLTAGMNLISLPSAPANGDVNEIFGDAEAVDLVFTFEGSQSKVAIRNQETGGFVGTLTTVDAQHAYWVSAENAVTIDISIPPTSQLAPPPYLTVLGGEWNLLPVMSLGAVDDNTKGEGAEPGTPVDADSYLGEFRTAFGWTGRSWMKIDPDGASTADVDRLATGPEVKVGKGYWVLFEEDSIITP
jgi:hypothetical protein